MMEIETTLTRAHRDNIQRYHKLLKTNLTEVERNYIDERLSEEQAILQVLQSGRAENAVIRMSRE
jgi:hypothetical protein